MRHRSRWIAFSLAMGASIAVAIWISRRESPGVPVTPETEAHRQIRRAVLHNVSSELVNEVLRIEANEKHIAETVWAREMLAQECGRTIERLWDEINSSTNKLEVLSHFPIAEVQLGQWKPSSKLPQGISLFESVSRGPLLDRLPWQDFLARSIADGWMLEQIEFRHNQSNPDSPNHRAQSRYYFAANLLNKSRKERASIEGVLDVRWGSKDEHGAFTVHRVDATRLTIKTRQSDPPFTLVRDDEIKPQGQSKLIDPLILYDLDGNGLSEIILAARNLVYRNHGNFQFTTEPLCRHPQEFIGTALLADINGDHAADLVCANWEGLFVFLGSPEGVFEAKGRLSWKPETPLQKPMVLTSADIDSDGDLDLYLAQYKDPYEGGLTPRPFYSANDGYPAHLLVNDGLGGFQDRTTEAGLGAKRTRRTFSASFADLDHDSHLDLLVVNDFAGADIYRNNGEGAFEDVTSSWLETPQAFGMAHNLADFNNDGLLDFLMIGMTSPTLERLNHLGLARAKDGREREMELRMTFGNRLFFGTRRSGSLDGFQQNLASDSIADAGWAWGCASSDFDNDGFVDVYIANGFQSAATVADSEGDYWLHDRFVESKLGSQATDLYFKSAGARNKGAVRSFGGYERNRFYWNRGGTNFVEIGYLMGLSLIADSRNVVADDLDADGRVDLVLTTQETWPHDKQTLKLYRNRMENSGDYLEVPVSATAWGRQIEVETESGKRIGVYATGAGFRSQSAARLHFGLGFNRTKPAGPEAEAK